MPKETLTYEDVLRIVALVKTTRFSEFRLKVGEIEVHLRRKNGAAGEPSDAPLAASRGETPVPSGAAAERAFAPGAVLVRAPMVGTFYRAPAPGGNERSAAARESAGVPPVECGDATTSPATPFLRRRCTSISPTLRRNSEKRVVLTSSTIRSTSS